MCYIPEFPVSVYLSYNHIAVQTSVEALGVALHTDLKGNKSNQGLRLTFVWQKQKKHISPNNAPSRGSASGPFFLCGWFSEAGWFSPRWSRQLARIWKRQQGQIRAKMMTLCLMGARAQVEKLTPKDWDTLDPAPSPCQGKRWAKHWIKKKTLTCWPENKIQDAKVNNETMIKLPQI